MKWIAKRESVLAAALLGALLCACLVLSGVAASAEPAPASQTRSDAAPAASRPVRALQATPVVHLEAELLSAPVPLAESEETDAEPAEAEEAAPELTPTLAQYAAETVQSSVESTYIPAALAACTADAEIPDDLERLDSFIATAYYITGNTSTGAYTTLGRTLAVNPGVVPYGTHVWMFLDDGTFVGDFIAEDTGSNMIAHPHVIDIYMGADSYNECILWGAQHVTLYTSPAESAE